ncbi:MAG: 3-methyl-2-oxobutanoate hydroxymethyltransferase [Actinobacteria bacterium]|nr:3-methyl-2-oxobutanoate hydroxymethyltransferase [Actinomycetota bacterium]
MAEQKKTTISVLYRKKQAGEKIVMLSSTDAVFATLQARADVDILLAGDSAATTVLGYDSTLPVTMDWMVEMAQAIRRGAPYVYLIGDMPFMSYQACTSEAIHNAGRFMTQAGCDAVKIECDRRQIHTVEAVSSAGIPVMAHLGLLPQSAASLGGYRTQARTAEAAAELINDAKAMTEAGAAFLLLEGVPPEPAQIITAQSSIPVIGCGAGPHVDGQVMIMHDVLGLTLGRKPTFAKAYAQLAESAQAAFAEYAKEVRQSKYPSAEQCYSMAEGEREKLNSMFPTS